MFRGTKESFHIAIAATVLSLVFAVVWVARGLWPQAIVALLVVALSFTRVVGTKRALRDEVASDDRA